MTSLFRRKSITKCVISITFHHDKNHHNSLDSFPSVVFSIYFLWKNGNLSWWPLSREYREDSHHSPGIFRPFKGLVPRTRIDEINLSGNCLYNAPREEASRRIYRTSCWPKIIHIRIIYIYLRMYIFLRLCALHIYWSIWFLDHQQLEINTS